MTLRCPRRPGRGPSGPVYFASGSNRPGEIRGLAEAGHDLGVDAREVLKYPDAVAELERVAALGVRVFLDSGAFSEVDVDERGNIAVISPIMDEEWSAILALGKRLAKAFGDRLYLVAPDMVAEQEVTLWRMRRWRRQVQACAKLGARVLAPVPGGALSRAEMFRRARAALGVKVIPSFPMVKSATLAGEVIDFVQQVQPAAVHLLGMGPTAQHAEDLLGVLQHLAPGIAVTMDASPWRRWRQKGRLLERPMQEVAEEMSWWVWGVGGPPAGTMPGAGGDLADYTEEIAHPSGWLSHKGKQAIARAAGLTAAQRKRWMADPDAFLQEDMGNDVCWYEHPVIALELDAAWARHQQAAGGRERQRRYIKRGLGALPLEGGS